MAFHIVDSQSLRWFCHIGITEEGFRKSALNRNVKAITVQTWEMINRYILEYANQEDIEKGRKVHTDCTCMCRSEYVFHRLRRFRAGIESGITWPKRSMGLTRCMWKGWHAFKSYIWSSIAAAKLLTMARANLATT